MIKFFKIATVVIESVLVIIVLNYFIQQKFTTNTVLKLASVSYGIKNLQSFERPIAHAKSIMVIDNGIKKETITLYDKICFSNNKTNKELTEFCNSIPDFECSNISWFDFFQDTSRRFEKTIFPGLEFDFKIRYSVFCEFLELPIKNFIAFKTFNAVEIKRQDKAYSKISVKQIDFDIKVKFINKSEAYITVSNVKCVFYINELSKLRHSPGRSLEWLI